VREFHGGVGPWAVVGYRMGERALHELGLERHSHDLRVSHFCPKKVQFTCMADGVHAATGASGGKLNLQIFESARGELHTTFENIKTGRSVTFRIEPKLAEKIKDLPYDQFEAVSAGLAKEPDEALFSMDR
jgi:formylmethanofuran dehydrogenase subunit E